MSLDRSNEIEELLEAARDYYALQNSGRERGVRPQEIRSVRPFGPEEDQPIVPEFGLAEVKYAYTREDVDEAENTLGRYDRNEDGYIDRQEVAQGRWNYRNPFEMDLNKDGRLSRLELIQRYARRRLLEDVSDELQQQDRRLRGPDRSRRDESRSRRRNDSDRLADTLLDRFDADRNDVLGTREAERLGVPVDVLDIDGDRQITADELQAYVQEKQAQATDPDGTAKHPPDWFDELDANLDGQIAMAEFSREWTAEKLSEFRMLDGNDDGLLTLAEVTGSPKVRGHVYASETAEVLPPGKTIVSEVEVTDDYSIGDLNLRFSITHSRVSDLDGYLTGPDGQRIELFSDVGDSDDHFDETVLDDQAAEPIDRGRAPFRGTYAPEASTRRGPSLSHFNGKSVKGVWQLVIRGARSERFGMLHGWALLVQPLEDGSAPTPSPADESDSEGRDEP
jgi:subtilisin-like proprotein convertase family protein/Ca2+-binding EF-hand superfamily protein